jgi:hypothetical protein
VTYLDEIAQAVRERLSRNLLPDVDDLDQLFRLYALLARAKGEATTSADVHDAWSAWMLGRGESHESIKPYEQLDGDTKREDEPFLLAIRKVAAKLREARREDE